MLVWRNAPVPRSGRYSQWRHSAGRFISRTAELDEQAWRQIIDQIRDVDRQYPFEVSVMGPVYGDEWPTGTV